MKRVIAAVCPLTSFFIPSHCYISSLPFCRFINSPTFPASIVRYHSPYNRQIAAEIRQTNATRGQFSSIIWPYVELVQRFVYPYEGYVPAWMLSERIVCNFVFHPVATTGSSLRRQLFVYFFYLLSFLQVLFLTFSFPVPFCSITG